MKFIIALTLLVFGVEADVVPGIDDLEGQSKFDYITLTTPVPWFEALSLQSQQMFLNTFKMCDRNVLGYTGQDAVDLEYLNFNNPTPTAKCLSFCYLKSFRYLNETQDLQKCDLYDGLTPEICDKVVLNIITACQGVTGTGNCDKAYNMYQCIMPKVLAARNGYLVKDCI